MVLNATTPTAPSTWGVRLLSPTGQRRRADEAYGSNGSITRQVDYDYDALRRLIKEDIESASSPQGNVRYDVVTPNSTAQGYDPVGNRLSRKVTSSSTPSLTTAGVTDYEAHTFDGRDRLVVGTAYTYDANGNTVGDAAGATYVYDAENRLIKRSGGSLDTVELAYDADGNRVKKTVTPAGGAPTVTLYLVEDRNPTGYAQVMEERVFTEPSSTGLVGYWPLEEGSGTTAVDQGGSAQNGTLLNGTAWTNGPVGGALRFDGVDDSVSVPDASELRLVANLTVAFWFKKNAEASDWVRLVGKGDPTYRNYCVFEEAGVAKRILFQVYAASGTSVNLYSTVNLEVGRWYHVACTYDGTAARIYINGTPAGQQTATCTARTSADPVTFGYAGYHTYLNGALDEVRLYSRALSAPEVGGLVGTSCKYVYGLDLVSQSRNTGTAASPVWTTHYYGYDGLGSVRYLTDVNGAVTDTYTYDAFGILIDQTPATGQTVNSYRYTGEQWDADLGMYYLRARYLNPTTGRFWTQDSWEGNNEDPLSLHKYLYATGNPVNECDPSGKMSLLSATIVVGTIAVVLAYVGYEIHHSKAMKKMRIGDALVRNSRMADHVDIAWLDAGFAMISNSEFNKAKDAIHDGTTTVFIIERGEIRHGAHVGTMKGKIFIPIAGLKAGPDRAAFFAFGEYQHDVMGGELPEAEAQAQFDKIVATLRPPYNTWTFFRHGEY